MLLFSLQSSFASDSGEYVNAAIATQSFVWLFYVISYISGAALLLSIVSIFGDYDRFKQRAENPSRQIVFRFVIAAVLMNPSVNIKMMSETLGFETSSSNEFCFAYNLVPKGGTDGGIKTDGSTRECYSSNMNKLQSTLLASNENINKDELGDFLNGRFKVVIGVFQIIALYFYLSAWFKIYSISEGKERQTTYAKQLIVIVFSTIFLNLPAAINFTLDWVSSLIKTT